MQQKIGFDPGSTRRLATDAATRDLLATARSLTEPALRTALKRLHTDSVVVASYHLGWTDTDGTPTDAVGGKMLRAALSGCAAMAAGASPRLATPSAVAVELMHNFSLIHDDIMDEDIVRRGRPAAWTVFGIGPALLAADALFAQSFAVLSELGTPSGARAVRRLASAAQHLSRGQASDLAFERRPWTGPDAVTADEYLAMIEEKTGALFGFAAGAGAALAGASAPFVDLLDRIGLYLGVAFQLADDAGELCCDPTAALCLQHTDLRRRKKTLPVICALQAGTVGNRLADLLAAGNLADSSSLHRAAALIEESGGLERTRRIAGRHLAQAAMLIRELPCNQAARVNLLALAGCTAGLIAARQT